MEALADNEKWIPGYEGLYSASSDGRIRSYYGRGGETPRQLRPDADKDGYLHVTLRKDGKSQRRGVGRLVAFAFIPNPNFKPEINHIDGDKKNNAVENLEWVTRSENETHAYRNHLATAEGARIKNSKPVVQLEKSTMKVIRHFLSMKEAEKITHICKESIGECCNKKTKTAGGYIWKFDGGAAP